MATVSLRCNIGEKDIYPIDGGVGVEKVFSFCWPISSSNNHSCLKMKYIIDFDLEDGELLNDFWNEGERLHPLLKPGKKEKEEDEEGSDES